MESKVIEEPFSQQLNCDTLFYDPASADGRLDIWLRHNRPSTRLNNRLRWLAVVHPESDVDKSQLNRLGQTSQEVIDFYRPRLQSVSHAELLTMAVKINVLKGYWMIICDNDEELDDYWFSFALCFYQFGRQLKYSRLECCRKEGKPIGGIIFVINDNFTDKATVFSLSNMCNIIACTKTRNLDNSKFLYYKPAFYTDLGMYSDKDALEKSYIFRSQAGFGGEPDFMGNVRGWFKNFGKEQYQNVME